MRKILTWIMLILVLIGALFGYYQYSRILAPNVPAELQNEYVHIPTGTSFQDVVDLLTENGQIKDQESFIAVAEMMNLSLIHI